MNYNKIRQNLQVELTKNSYILIGGVMVYNLLELKRRK
jgi:hypothetical protein